MVVSDGSKLVLIQCTVQCIATGTFFFFGGVGLLGWDCGLLVIRDNADRGKQSSRRQADRRTNNEVNRQTVQLSVSGKQT